MGEVIFQSWPIIVGYLLGSISFSYIVGKKVAGIDIREHGSKNAGATNTLRVLGKGPALLVLLLDALKGSLAVFIAMAFSTFEWVIVLTGLAAVIGHNWPLFYGFRGGKGIATAIGAMFTLVPVSFVITLVFGLITLFVFRYVSLASLVGATVLPLVMIYLKEPIPYLVGALIITTLAFVRHRSNIVRLINGNENKIGKL